MRTNQLAALATILVVAVVAALVARECGAPPRARPVRIEASESVMATVFRSWLTWLPTGGDGGEPRGLLLRDGDMILVSVELDSLDDREDYVRYVAGDGPVLRLTSNEWSTRLSGRIVTLSLASDSAWRWLDQASERELASLRSVSAPESLARAMPSGLKRLAAVNPNVGLNLGSEAALHQILPLFQPRALIMSDFTVDLRGHLARLGALETLCMSADDSASLAALPALRRLRRLALVEWDVEEAGPLPAGIRGLRSVWVVGDHVTQIPLNLRALPAGLEELSLVGMDSTIDLNHLPDLPALHTLILNGSDISGGLSRLASFQRLEWVGLPRNITQRELAELIAAHPDLKILEIVQADSVTDVAPLRKLKGLEGLVLIAPCGDLEPLKELKTLRFLGLQADTTRMSPQQRASIRKALPDALVVPVEPFHLCLGSGWILFLLPVTVAFWFLGWRRRKPRAAGARGA